ncbi:MAG: hypothetical protein ACOY94_20705 [Bacillota bacterium]
MVEIHTAGILMNLPDRPGVYIITCAHPGQTSYRLGEILYIGLSNRIRRRVAYALASPEGSAPHSAQKPLMEIQQNGGQAMLLYVALDSDSGIGDLGTALLGELVRRNESLPPWNKQALRKKPPDSAMVDLARAIADRLDIR